MTCHILIFYATKTYIVVEQRFDIPGVSQNRPPKKTFLCRKGGLGYFKVTNIVPNLLMIIRKQAIKKSRVFKNNYITNKILILLTQ